jgi:hypothetical protein
MCCAPFTEEREHFSLFFILKKKTNVSVPHNIFSRCYERTYPGLPNPTFRNQEFFVKNQEFNRRFFLENQEKNQALFFKESGNHQEIFSKNPKEYQKAF